MSARAFFDFGSTSACSSMDALSGPMSLSVSVAVLGLPELAFIPSTMPPTSEMGLQTTLFEDMPKKLPHARYSSMNKSVILYEPSKIQRSRLPEPHCNRPCTRFCTRSLTHACATI